VIVRPRGRSCRGDERGVGQNAPVLNGRSAWPTPASPCWPSRLTAGGSLSAPARESDTLRARGDKLGQQTHSTQPLTHVSCLAQRRTGHLAYGQVVTSVSRTSKLS